MTEEQPFASVNTALAYTELFSLQTQWRKPLKRRRQSEMTVGGQGTRAGTPNMTIERKGPCLGMESHAVGMARLKLIIEKVLSKPTNSIFF